MAVRQIHHMDIVADAGSVRRIIIVSEYAYLFQLAYRHLGNIGVRLLGIPSGSSPIMPLS